MKFTSLIVSILYFTKCRGAIPMAGWGRDEWLLDLSGVRKSGRARCFAGADEGRSSALNATATAVFNLVHAGIGCADNGVDVGAVVGCRAYADAGTDREIQSFFHV